LETNFFFLKYALVHQVSAGLGKNRVESGVRQNEVKVLGQGPATDREDDLKVGVFFLQALELVKVAWSRKRTFQ
jgi:hypothetical protein